MSTSLRSRFVLVASLALGLALVLARPAVAQSPGSGASPGAAAAAGGPPSYSSPMRDPCEQELAKDAGWLADLKTDLLVSIHKEAARTIARNERHVFIAYGVIWVLIAGFVAMMWLRQGKLVAEIKRLDDELRRAERDGGAAAPVGKA